MNPSSCYSQFGMTSGCGDNPTAADVGPPRDKYSLALTIMLIQGLSSLFPWNVFITAAQYFSNRFCDTPFGHSFETYFSVAYTWSQTFGLALSVVYQDKFSLSSKVMIPISCYTLLFGLTALLVLIPADPIPLFWFTLVCTALCGLFGAFLSAGLFGLGAVFPPKYRGSLMTGQGLAGLLVSISSTVTIWTSPPEIDCTSGRHHNDHHLLQSGIKRILSEEGESCPSWKIDYGAFVYFLFATLLLCFCMASFLLLQRLPFTRFYLQAERESSKRGEEVTANIYEDGSTTVGNPMEYAPCAVDSYHGLKGDADTCVTTTDSPVHSASSDSQINEMIYMTTNDLTTWNCSKRFTGILHVFKKLKLPAISVMVTFAVTIGIFPSTIVQISSTQRCLTDARVCNDMFLPLLFFLFNASDFIGRLIAEKYNSILQPHSLLFASLSRGVFFPLFLLCNIEASTLPVVFGSDLFPIAFMIIFAFTSGYIASCSMILGPSLVNMDESWLAGTIMTFFLAFGLTLGAVISIFTMHMFL